MSHTTRIVIIGGGASGTIAAVHLLNELKKQVHICIIEKNQDYLFKGAAYSGTLQYEILNVPAGKMSIYSDHPTDFFNWLKEKKQPEAGFDITPDSFVSRRWYGQYLAEQLDKARYNATNAQVQIQIATVSDIGVDNKARAYLVKLADGKTIVADYVIFATGNEPPVNILSNLEQALLGPKYVANPWIGNPFASILPDDDVLIIGSGLSMADHAISLKQRNHRGRIYSFSRHGLLPLQQLIGKEKDIDLTADTGHILQLFKKLRSAVHTEKNNGIHWQAIINALRDDTPVIWKRMSTASKKIFMARLRHYWEVHRHRMPAESYTHIQDMINSGLLRVIAGRYAGITTSGKGFIFRYVPKGQLHTAEIPINAVINCTGPGTHYLKGSNWLIKNLISKGWMKEDDLRIGIETGYNGEIITSGGSILPKAYAIGPLRKASEWESTAIREIRIQAEQLALDIALNDNEPELLIRICHTN